MERGRIVQIAIATIMVAVMIIGRPVNYPDNAHTLHGVPLVWGTHQLITIAGPVDTWIVSLTNMALDLLIWVSLILITPYIEKMSKKK
ncbi:hypothetical protein E4H04_10965 [Candidatus Bathyarchaeota archaeon]|nr:MAG: hypothetical protein E4H04_10965 [Candidatus Bathyarchaeota archaeon]